MNLSKQIATHIRTLYLGKNWTASSFKDQLNEVNWEMASRKVGDLNTIATLVYHTQYYIRVQMPVLNGEPLVASDKESFEHPEITNEEQWQALLSQVWEEVEDYAAKIEALPEDVWEKDFAGEKYGSYYRNIQGVIEHSHYHLGQIVLLKRGLTVTI